eukprot:6207856-Pleurochrysis_carterae.AAC.2
MRACVQACVHACERARECVRARTCVDVHVFVRVRACTSSGSHADRRARLLRSASCASTFSCASRTLSKRACMWSYLHDAIGERGGATQAGPRARAAELRRGGGVRGTVSGEWRVERGERWGEEGSQEYHCKPSLHDSWSSLFQRSRARVGLKVAVTKNGRIRARFFARARHWPLRGSSSQVVKKYKDCLGEIVVVQATKYD